MKNKSRGRGWEWRGVGGREASVRAAKVKTHLPPNAIQSPERWQDRGGMWGRGYETMIVK